LCKKGTSIKCHQCHLGALLGSIDPAIVTL
jgi:hypothetical protein